MTAPIEAVEEATAAVFVAGRRVGSAVVVDVRRLLTAAHVLRRIDESGRTGLVDEVELVFPALVAKGGELELKVSARRAPPSLGADWLDAAVLDVVSDSPTAIPRPVQLWAAQRPPERVRVFGFPKAEKPLRGVWRDFNVSGTATDGTVQLDWATAVGTLPGHSGGPVVDLATAALVGVLTEGSEKGLFDRFVPLTSVWRVWADLPRPWLMVGQDARNHFARRATGQRSRARGGDLFRGRKEALAAVRTWLTSDHPPGRVLVVTGQPGGGKSAVIARVALGLETERLGPGLAFHARAATNAQFLAAVGELIGVRGTDSRDSLLDAVLNMPGDDRKIIIVDGLDEAASAFDRQQMAETLSELAALPGLRVAAATRAAATRSRHSPDSLLLRTLGVGSPSRANLIDLDADRYFDMAGLAKYAEALLAQEGAIHPGPPEAAWMSYRSHTDMRDRLARVVAAQADRNYLVAAMAAFPLSQAGTARDPEVPGFDAGTIPSGIGEALGKWLETLPQHEH